MPRQNEPSSLTAFLLRFLFLVHTPDSSPWKQTGPMRQSETFFFARQVFPAGDIGPFIHTHTHKKTTYIIANAHYCMRCLYCCNIFAGTLHGSGFRRPKKVKAPTSSCSTVTWYMRASCSTVSVWLRRRNPKCDLCRRESASAGSTSSKGIKHHTFFPPFFFLCNIVGKSILDLPPVKDTQEGCYRDPRDRMHQEKKDVVEHLRRFYKCRHSPSCEGLTCVLPQPHRAVCRRT